MELISVVASLLDLTSTERALGRSGLKAAFDGPGSPAATATSSFDVSERPSDSSRVQLSSEVIRECEAEAVPGSWSVEAAPRGAGGVVEELKIRRLMQQQETDDSRVAG